MKQERALGMLIAAGAIASLGLCPLAGAAEREVQHVLVISVDGLHAVDAERFIASHPQSALAEIARHAVRYTAASTSRPSDSFPGLLSIVTGGSPASADVFYDVSWDRTQWPPGPAGCTGTPGQQTTYDESIDLLKVVNGQPGGYVDGSGAPTAVLEYALEQTDVQLARVLTALKSRHIYDSTLIIVTAKHGQAPIDPLKVNPSAGVTNKIGGLQTLVANYASSSDAVAQAIVNAGENEDDVALIWLQDQTRAPAAAQWLRDNNVASGLHIQQVLSGDLLKLRYRDPATDNHTPDIIVVPELGTIYTTSKKKNAEHGGFSSDDTNVALIVSQPGFAPKEIKGAVLTTQIAPTILRALELDPNGLQAVQIEHTEVLPGLGL